jgi:hypothetical protein
MTSIPSEAKAPPAEAQLLNHVQHLSDARAGQRAVLFHLSRLQRHHRRDTHLQIAANMLEDIVRRFSGRLFVLATGDIVLICKSARRKTLESAVALIRYLFHDDPLAQHDDSGSAFCSLFDLEADYDRFLGTVRRLKEAQERRLAGDLPRRGEPAARPRRPLDPEHLGEVLGIINRADLSNVMRRQSVWSMAPGARPQPLFEELFVSIDELGRALAPDYQLGNDRWLFQYLTQALDRRVLARLVRDYPTLSRALSLNVNVATLLSPEFAAFEEYLPTRARGNIVLELQLADIWSDVGAYLFAQNVAKQKGYRLALDGVRRRALPLIDAGRLGVDYVKLIWEDGLLTLEAEELQEFRRAVETTPARIVLMRCDRADALDFGRGAGISLFQGWYLDGLTRD